MDISFDPILNKFKKVDVAFGFAGIVNTYADLPLATEHLGELWYVRTTVGSDPDGVYYSDGLVWEWGGYYPVNSVFGRIGSVTAQSGDYTASQVTNVTAGSNLIATNVQSAIDEIQTSNPGIKFNISSTPIMQEGVIAWDSTNGTVQIGMPGGNVNLQLGQEQHVRAKATENITNGQAVRISGASGSKPEVSLTNNLEDLSAYTVALATENVTSGQQGYFTTFGLVNDINTNNLIEGGAVWLDSTDGALTATMPTNPSLPVYIGVCIVKSATVGKIFVEIDAKRYLRDNLVTKEPTGFIDPENVVVSYDSTTRKITLTGTVEAYWKGEHIDALTSGWVSSAHDDTVGSWFLYYDGTNFVWSNSPWTFDKLQIALVNYMASNKFAMGETHGTEPWPCHEEFHRVIGTYKLSGGDLGSYTLNSTTAAERRPTVSECIIKDEDLPTTNLAITNDLYTQVYLAGAGATVTWVLDAADIIPLSGNNPYYNQFTGGAWQQTLLTANQHTCIWLAAIPAAKDATSQKYRFLWIQGQSAGTLASQQALTPSNLTLAGFLNTFPEYVFIGKVIIQYTATNWQIIQVDSLSGTRYNQTSTTGGYLTSVSTDSTLTGNGTASSPLKMSGTFTPDADSTTAYQFTKADGTTVIANIDTTNSRVGIGVSSPHARLSSIINTTTSGSVAFYTSDFSDGVSGSGLLFLTGTATGDTFSEIRAFKTGNSAWSNLILQQGGGNVGIGTTAPTTKLDVNLYDAATNTVASVLKLSHTTSGTAASGLGVGITFFSQRPASAINLERAAIYAVSGFDPDDNGELIFCTRTSTGTTESTEKVRISSAGNVGIGTTSPGSVLDVIGGSTGFRVRRNSTDDTLLNIVYDSTSDSMRIASTYGSTGAFKPMTFFTSDTERMRISSTGNVGIGTTSPDVALDVNGYTQLGSDAPKIKMKKITGTTAGSQGGNASVAHGLTASKIISVSGSVNYATSSYLALSSPEAGYQAQLQYNDTNIVIFNVNSASANVLSKPFIVTIIYEE